MRRRLAIAAALALVAAGVAVLAPRPSGTPPAAAAPAAPAGPLPAFRPVAVEVHGAQGLVLTGTVRDAGGRPVAGAEVALAASSEATLGTARCDVCGAALLACPSPTAHGHLHGLLAEGRGVLTPRASARTDAAGAFRFEGLAGVAFTVWARAPGLGAAVRERAAPGEPVALFLPAERTLAGRVVDEAGAPVPGARVTALPERLAVPTAADAGPDGAFALHGLGEGPFHLVAAAPGFLPVAAARVAAGAAPARLVLARERTLEVRVLEDGAPVRGATVRAWGLEGHLDVQARAPEGEARLAGLPPAEVTVTAEAGDGRAAAPRTVRLGQGVTRVELQLSAAGVLQVTPVDGSGQPVPSPRVALRTAGGETVREVRAATGALVTLGPVPVGAYTLEARADGYADAALPVRVEPGEAALEVVLRRAVTLSGRVLDVYGRPAPGVSVLVQPTGEAVHADADGRFVAPVPSPGLYTLHAHHSEWGGGTLQASAPAEGLTLALEPGASVEVTVTSEGRRVEGAEVVLGAPGEGTFRSDEPSGPDGVVPMRGLPAGTYWLSASGPRLLPAEPQRVTVRDGETVQVAVELSAGAALTGEVVDEAGAPVPGARVAAVPRGAEPVVTDAEGRFELRPLRPGRRYALDVRHPRYDLAERSDAVAGGGPVRLVLRGRPLVRGRVVGSRGGPLPRFRVDEHDVQAADGRFELPLSSAGTKLVFMVEAPGHAPQMVERAADAGRVTDVGDITLAEGEVVTGRVVDAGGGPVEGAAVGCDACEAEQLTDADGGFTLDVPPYVPQVVVTARQGERTASRTVRRGTRERVELALRPAATLSGTVWGADGRPAGGVEVDAVHLEGQEPVSVVTAADGTFRTELPPGPYRLLWGGAREYSGQASVVARVEGAGLRLDLGPAPGTASLGVKLRPARGHALFVVRGDAGPVAEPLRELLRSAWAQVVYSPAREQVTLTGLPPGRYTVVWGAFHTASKTPPLVRTVTLPGDRDVDLTQ